MNSEADILQRIIQHKKIEVAKRKQQKSLLLLKNQLANAPILRGFKNALMQKVAAKQIAIIAEIKKASPSKGILREDFIVPDIAYGYEKAGAAALSVLTDEAFFMGSDNYLMQARQACALPLLRKDFIVDEYQIYESRIIGADCILLIVAALDDQELLTFSQLAHKLGLDVLVEVHDADELARALKLDVTLIGINNRNLRTFHVDLQTTLSLLQKIPKDKIVVTESGIHTHQDIELMLQHHVYSFLIGESFMRAEDPGQKLAELLKTKK